jgi:uncharacterized protein YodC (DUF2158 family)
MNAGDVVQLKSGGPPMTIVEVEGDWATCTWFGDKKKHESDSFQLVTLKPYVLPVPRSHSPRRALPARWHPAPVLRVPLSRASMR